MINKVERTYEFDLVDNYKQKIAEFVDRLATATYALATTIHMAPKWTGLLIDNTFLQKELNGFTISVLVPYAEKIYPFGGIIPSGQPMWLHKSVFRNKPSEMFAEVFR